MKTEISEPASELAALEALARRVIESARLRADDGTILYAPDGSGYYRGIWTRDFCYLAEGAGELVPAEHIRQGFEYLIRRQHGDGRMPSMVSPGGVAAYVTVGDPERDADADNAPFMVKMAEAHRRRTGSPALFEQYLDALVGGMDCVPRNESGLVWIDPDHPHTGYGFRDCMGVQGADAFCTLLYWEAATLLARVASELRRCDIAERFAEQARQIEAHLPLMMDSTTGVFLVGTVGERHVDIWANAFFIHLGLPAPALRARAAEFLVQHCEEYLQNGQVRHLCRGQSWDRVHHYSMPEGIYQNGAYWGTASGWVLSAFLEADRNLAWNTAETLVHDFLERGVYECVNRGFLWGGHGVEYTKVAHYVASITNPLPVIQEIYDERLREQAITETVVATASAGGIAGCG